MSGAAAMATATTLAAFFPEKRRARLADVATLVQSLQDDGTVTATELLKAAAAQSPMLCADDGKACPGVLRWLREHRWLDTQAQPEGGGVPANWADTRSGVEAMGQRVGLPPYDQSAYRLLSDYEAEVRRRLEAQQVAA